MRPFTAIAGVIFLLIALAHVYRIVSGFPVTIGSATIGQEVSWVAAAICAVLAFGLFKEARR